MDSSQYVDSGRGRPLDRLAWGKWHWLIVTALGVTWILDGLEATLGSPLGGILKDPHLSLGLSDAQFGLGATIYLTALTQTIAWSVIFFIASAAASSAYFNGQRDFFY